MRSPARSLAGNLRWTRSGTVWADWQLRALPYGFRPDKDKHEVRALHQALFRALPGESLLLGLCSGLDPAAVVERMLDGVELDRCPDWAAECAATLDSLDEIGPGQRVFWLSVPLADGRASDRLLEPLRAAAADLRDSLALPRAGIPDADLARRLEQARKVAEGIPAPFRPKPATPAQLVWLHLHAQQRGLFLDMDLPDSDARRDVSGQLLTPRSGATLPEPLLDEGGQSDLSRRDLRSWSPLNRRYLKVDQPGRPDDTPPSYQSMLVLSDVPAEGMIFPGSEFVGRIDECGLEVDWAMRLQVRSSDQVAAQNRRALVNLNEQYGQREGEISHGLNTLDQAAADLAEYARVLESDKLEVEVQATTVFCVAAATPEGANDQARSLADYLGAAGYKVARPLGLQEDLWWAMQPGAPANKAVREFAQITTSRALAAAIPLASTELGDNKGSLLGLNISTGRPGVVLHDIAGAATRDVSGSLAIAGELGAGKALATDTLIATPTGWARMADLAAGDQVFDEMGQPTIVLGVSPVTTERRCFEVAFSDGSTITADAEHLWTTVPDRVRGLIAKGNHRVRAGGGTDTVDLAERTAALTGEGWPGLGETVTTETMGRTLRRGVQANHAIPLTAALDLPAVDLPIDPYVLGVWLGDGSSNTAQITSADPEVPAFVAAAGYTVTKLTRTYHYAVALPGQPSAPVASRPCEHCGTDMVRPYESRRYCSHRCSWAARKGGAGPAKPAHCQTCGRRLGRSSTGLRCAGCWHASTLRGRLGRLDLLQNKHIPPSYLRAGTAQRRALLAGLLDTDGTVSPGGAVEFTDTNPQLARDVHELACSLGYRATIRDGRAQLKGRDCGPKWTVAWTTTDPVFWLPRKLRTLAQRTARSSPARNRFRYVTAVREVPSVPVRCIRVASPSRLYLAGRAMIPTHNSLTLKKLAGDVVDRGGRVICADRTPMGEYADWARSVTQATVVDINAPQVSLDPLRLFGTTAGSRVTQSFLTPLLNIAPTSERGVLISDVLDPVYLHEHGITGLGSLQAHLKYGCQLTGANDLARTMNVFARRDFGSVIFDETLPPLRASTPAVVIRTHTLELPTRAELEHEHLFAQMRLEKIFGRAMYALIAALARQICFSDPGVLGLFVVDEAHHITASPEGEREIVDFVRDGRKHRAAVALGSHDPEEDFGSPTLRGLIPTRILMRHRDRTLARRGLAWLDMDPDDDLVELLTEGTSPVGPSGVDEHRRGEAFLRDSSGNVGRVKVLAPCVPARNSAVRTSPPERKLSSGGASR